MSEESAAILVSIIAWSAPNKVLFEQGGGIHIFLCNSMFILGQIESPWST